MGHGSLKTTERYLHYRQQANEAELLAGAFDPSEKRVPNGVPNRRLPSVTQRISESRMSLEQARRGRVVAT